MLQRFLLIALTLCSLTATAQWQQTGSKVRYVNGLGIPTKDTAAGVAADSSQIVIRPADSALYIKYKRTWLRVGGGGGSIAGSGTTNYVPKFTSSTAIGNSQIFDNGTNVGIGTASPAKKLDIRGTDFIIDDATNGRLTFEVLAAQNTIYSTTSAFVTYKNFRLVGDNLFFHTGGLSERMRITSGGNVGIGTASPAIYTNYTTLELSGTTGSVFRLRDAAVLGEFEMATNSSVTYLKNITNTPLTFGTNNAERMRITSGGNTLIGTTTDNGVDKLQVSGSVTASGTLTAATIVKSGGTSSQFLMADGSTSLGSGGSLSGTTNYVPKFTSSTAIGNSSIFDNGNVSLRTTASTYAVNMNTGANSGIGFYEDGTQSTIIGQNQNITATNQLSLRGANLDLVGIGSTYVRVITNSSEKMRVTSSGRVLMGTTLPTDNNVDALQVNGSISGIGMKQAYVTKTGAYTATNDDYVIDCTSGTFTVTLPASSGRTGRILIIKNSGAGTITVDGNGAETIDGAATYAISVQYGTVQIMSDGTNWKIIAKF